MKFTAIERCLKEKGEKLESGGELDPDRLSG